MDRGERPFDNRPAGQNNQRQMPGSGGRQPRQDSSPKAQNETRHTPKMPAAGEDRPRIQNAPPAAGLRTQSVVRLPTGGAKVSLQSLKSSEKGKDEPPADVPTIREMKQQHAVPESRKEVNTADLRSILNQMMSEKKPEVKPEEIKKPIDMSIEDDKKHSEGQGKPVSDKETSSGNILKPGDTVKF